MTNRRIYQLIAVIIAAALVFTSVAAATNAAPVRQLRSQSVAGTIPGGQFAEVWLDLEVIEPGTVSVLATWDRSDLSGIGFFILDANNVATVTSGGRARDNNIAAGSPLQAFRGSPNQQEAVIRATAANYTLIVFNESPNDASFTLDATNAYITDDSGNVTDPNAVAATPDPAEEAEGADGVTEDTGDATTDDSSSGADESATEASTAATTPEPAASTEAASDETEDTGTTESVAEVTAAGVVRAAEVEGELVTKEDIHYLGLEPELKDGTVNLSMRFDPQDVPELARRLNFWVLDERGFNQFLGGDSLSKVAIAAGSSTVDTADNERSASFKSVGFGPYTVLLSNTSEVQATYTLSAEGALLVDESGQTLTAQRSVVMTDTVATGEETPAAGATTEADTSASTTPAAATSTRDGEPGGTYTVQSGDTMYLIAQDIYGNGNVYQDLCDFNNIANCNLIEVDDVIELPTTAELGSGATVPTTSTATTSPLATPSTSASAAVTGTATVTSTATVTGTGTVTDTTGSDADAMVGEEASGTLLDVLAADGRFKNLIAAVDAAGLTDEIADGGLTILAPTDAAFAALPSGALQELVAQLQTNPDGQLFQILLYHLADGTLLSDDIEDGLEVQTRQGNTVKFEIDEDGNITVNGATISDPDILASDGVIHAIDAVILPPLE